MSFVDGYHWYIECPECGQTLRMSVEDRDMRVCQVTYLDEHERVVDDGCGAVLQATVDVVDGGSQ